MVSQALADVLAAGRPRFNAQVAEWRRRQPRFDPAALPAFVRDALDPVAQALQATDPARARGAVAAAFEVALALVAQGHAGPAARQPWVDRAWREAAPRHAALLAREPVEVLGALSNAALHLAGVPGVRVADWLQAMAAAGPGIDDVATLRAFGQVAAWRAGMAHFRAGALAAADALPDPLALQALAAAPERDRAALRIAHADPWWDEAAAAPRVQPRVVGAFTGFGGSFAEPPRVRADGDGFVVRSGERHAWLAADAHGAVLLPATAAEFDAAASRTADARATLHGTVLRIGSRDQAIDLPADGLSLACGRHAAVLASPWSHALHVVPLPA